MQKFLSNQNKLFLILSLVILQVFLLKPIQVLADLPTGNAVKDPSAILRNALPIKQVELQELQHKLEETSDFVRGGRWPALTKTVTKCQSLLKKYQSKIIQELPNEQKKIAEKTFLDIGKDIPTCALSCLANSSIILIFFSGDSWIPRPNPTTAL